MTEAELLHQLALGEDSRHQFKRDATNADSMAAELAAFSNSGGGRLFIGVADDGSVVGLDAGAVRRLNQLLSNAASQHVRPRRDAAHVPTRRLGLCRCGADSRYVVGRY
ncbi:AlbA family DNA-binding domain-containing protein [Brenneria tiliae]|uniref:ATP-binding protein n=1 Tax=Brenneria tiliae TaxID=2914984 RepID=A0ABT0MV73_9GAMM|nr:ATP-binding protein [Brenneria tiliae]MCL2893741.1 ATP-binding protein [Brenneria tiliae]